jgi:predicted nuclease of predicted toxin-antitoxin system
MNFLADESVDRQIVDRLRQDGHFVSYVVEMEPGISDDAVLNLANKESTVLLTSDKDFGEMVFRQGRSNQGVILVRVAGLSPKSKADIVGLAIKEHVSELTKAFAVITPKSIRIRRRPIP